VRKVLDVSAQTSDIDLHIVLLLSHCVTRRMERGVNMAISS